MEKKTSNSIKYVLSAIMAAALLWVTFKGIDWDKFKEGLSNCEWRYVILSILIGIYSFWIRSRRWRETLLPIDPSTSYLTAFNAVNISYIINMVIPRGGEIVRCGIITQHSAKDAKGQRLASFDKVVGTVLVDRLWDTIVMVFILLGIFFAFKERWGSFFTDKLQGLNFSSTYILLAVAGLVLLLALLCYLFHDRNKVFGKLWNFAKGIMTGVRDSFKMPSISRFLVLTALLWLSYWATSATIIMALDGAGLGFENLGALDALFLMAVGSISSIIPVPGGFGAYHYLISVALSSIYGIPMETGLIFAVLAHESQAVAQIICGGASYVSETLRK